MSTPSGGSFSHRQSIRLSLGFAGLGVWSVVESDTPCLLSVTEFHDAVNLSVVGFVPRSGDPRFLHHVPGGEVVRIIDQFGAQRLQDEDGEPRDHYATEEEARELWSRLCAAFASHQAAIKADYAAGRKPDYARAARGAA